MSDTPIANCGHRKYPVRMVYPALVDQDERFSVRARICAACWPRWTSVLEEHTMPRENASQEFQLRPESCDWDDGCTEPVNGTILFVTSYPDGKTREDRCARLCAKHRADARQDLFCGT